MEDTLLRDIRKFLGETGMSPSYLGKLAVNNSEVVSRLERGKTVTLRTAVTLRRFMGGYRRSLRGRIRMAAE